ncbi:JAB domain-containing protein (plasmid) [Bacillus wiedmannii]|uniref:JAB domain-containing protein n=1 Tax=Bacillus wiedmannii TaxID=1890302 RepID=UPI0009B25D8D|nr:JAB domain-containing protein [Bacillus wiedmannii]WMS85464.1 JAB domain-containing protein [Bacillus wiedmannii]
MDVRDFETRVPQIMLFFISVHDLGNSLGYFKRDFLLLQVSRKILVRSIALITLKSTSVASIHASIVHPREIFKSTILNSIVVLILFHQHPSQSTNF